MTNFSQTVHTEAKAAKQRVFGIKRRIFYKLDSETLAWIKKREEERAGKSGGGKTTKYSKPNPVKAETVRSKKWRIMSVDY
ncbi:hypothetical protein H8E77_15930 [bacterium]|nr:hypothetical protein [bacterium]